MGHKLFSWKCFYLRESKIKIHKFSQVIYEAYKDIWVRRSNNNAFKVFPFHTMTWVKHNLVNFFFVRTSTKKLCVTFSCIYAFIFIACDLSRQIFLLPASLLISHWIKDCYSETFFASNDQKLYIKWLASICHFGKYTNFIMSVAAFTSIDGFMMIQVKYYIYSDTRRGSL